jgi:hypothetical protein
VLSAVGSTVIALDSGRPVEHYKRRGLLAKIIAADHLGCGTSLHGMQMLVGPIPPHESVGVPEALPVHKSTIVQSPTPRHCSWFDSSGDDGATPHVEEAARSGHSFEAQL